jgi:hypothetical protein
LDKDGDPVSGEPVTFEVEGANPTVGSASTNASGIATFSYVGSEEGDDTVVAHTSEAVSNTAIVLWRSSCPIRVFFGGGGSAAARTGTMGEAMVLIRRLQQTVDVVRLLERVRDEVLTTTPQGQRYIELFNQHASEITALMLADEALRDHGISTVEAFVPDLQALVDGEGSQTAVTPEQVNSVVAFLQALSAAGSPELTQDIETELFRRPLEPIAGMTMDKAWGYLNNLPPVAGAGGPYETDEGQAVLLDASQSSDQDNDIVLYEWDLDADREFDDATGITVQAVFGDNGTFQIGLKVTDSFGDGSTDQAEVMVDNLPPVVTLDTSDTIAFLGGDAFLGRVGVAQTHEATATDPGSDDLTFTWSFGVSTTYFNSGVGPDPYLSPGGTFPFTAFDSALATFASPGMYDLNLSVTDDDGDASDVLFAKLVTGSEACTLSQGFWKHQFSGQGNPQVDNDTLQAYLAIVNHASALFSEATPLTSLLDAKTVMDAKGSGMWPKAQAQLLAAWLNFAHGSVGWEELVDTDRDGTVDTPFHDVIAQAEAVLLKADPGQEELVLAKDLAEAINLLDEGSEGCD